MNKIALETSLRMFEHANVDRERMLAALRQMGAKHLKTKQMRDEYDPDNPTRNYCHVIAHFVWCYFAPPGSTSWALAVPDYDTWHRFVRWPDGTLVDLAAEQFPDYSLVEYENAKPMGFRAPNPDTRAQLLAKYYGIDPGAPIRRSSDFRLLV